MAHYSDERILKYWVNHGGGVNNIVVFATNPGSDAPCAFTSQTVTTTGDASNEAKVLQRHRRKIKRLNVGRS